MEITDPMRDLRPPRELRPDEAWCAWCSRFFVDGTAYDGHIQHGHCGNPSDLGMTTDRDGAWGFPTGKDGRAIKRKRSSAEVAFERMLETLMADVPASQYDKALEPLLKDIEKVRRELRRAKEQRQ